VTVAAPVVWKDRVFIADRDGVVRALSLTDGTELARAETESLGGFASTPVLRGDHLFVATVDGVGFVLDANTLEVRARFELGAASRTALLPTRAGVFIADDRGTIRVVDDAGQELWSRELAPVTVDPAVSPQGIVLVTIDGRLIVVAPEDGSERLNVAVPGNLTWSAPVIDSGRAFVASESGALSAVDLETGKLTWEFTLEEPLSGRIGIVGDTLFANTRTGQLVRLEIGADSEASIGASRAPSRDGIVSSGTSFVIAARAGLVRHLNVDGTSRWRFDAGDQIDARMLLTATHAILVTRVGRVIVLNL